ncbi:NHL repeat-containing protein [Chitinimonas koreensis]|uniref:NHL repeat-containing protein n=1 Tax=Chitinimonas koreensis TaxID=356302 RepID=UPI00040B6E1A|nr:NHL repeat-containing protein [Chitinimonas koreensis]
MGCTLLLQRQAPSLAQPTAAPVPLRLDGPVQLDLLAGDGIAGRRDGPAAQARFDDPFGLVADEAGNLYLADGGDANRIRRIGADGTVTTLAGSAEGFADGAGAAARFHTPSGLARDAAGNLYVADTGNHAIRKIGPQGTVSTLAGDGTAGYRDGPAGQARFDGPVGVAVDRRGNVFVADTYNDRIRVIRPDGTVATLAGGDRPGYRDGPGAEARFDTPCGIALDDGGNLWIADTRNRAIRKLAPDGQVSTLAQGIPEDARAVLRRPLSIAFGRDGALYVGEASHGRLLRIARTGELTALTGDDPAERLSLPAGLALDRDGRLHASDGQAHRLHRIGPRAGAVRPVVTGPAPADPMPATGGRWPLRPQDGWHEVVGTVGEVRGNARGESRDHLHNGLDVRGEVGETVLAIADAKVDDPLATWGYGRLGEGMALGALHYIHMRVGRDAREQPLDPARFQQLQDLDGKGRVRVRRGTRFRAGEALGSINAMAHVHLALGAGWTMRDPFELGLLGFTDRVAPTIVQIAVQDGQGKALGRLEQGRLVLARDGGPLQLVVEAYDQVDGNRPQRRLGLHALGYQLLRGDGTPLTGFEQPRVGIDFSRLPADDEAVKVAYAADSGITVYGSAATRFRYLAEHRVRDGVAEAADGPLAGLPAGDYLIRAVARDRAGNETRRELALTLR